MGANSAATTILPRPMFRSLHGYYCALVQLITAGYILTGRTFWRYMSARRNVTSVSPSSMVVYNSALGTPILKIMGITELVGNILKYVPDKDLLFNVDKTCKVRSSSIPHSPYLPIHLPIRRHSKKSSAALQPSKNACGIPPSPIPSSA